MIKRTKKKEEVSKILDELHGFGLFKEVTIHNIKPVLISETEEKERKEINKEYSLLEKNLVVPAKASVRC
jgi:hypothetical protein